MPGCRGPAAPVVATERPALPRLAQLRGWCGPVRVGEVTADGQGVGVVGPQDPLLVGVQDLAGGDGLRGAVAELLQEPDGPAPGAEHAGGEGRAGGACCRRVRAVTCSTRSR